MSELADRQMLLLSLQRALLGEVPASLRQASIEADPVLQIVRLRFESAELDEEGQEGCSCAATGVIADFPATWTLDEQHVVVPVPAALAPLANVAYRRAEPVDAG